MDELRNQNQIDTEEFWNKQKQIYKSAYVSIAILAINVIVFFISNKSLYSMGILSLQHVLLYGEWYRIITAMFLHADMEHLLSNMMMLILVGGIVEKHAGHLYYGIMFFVSGIVGNCLSLMYEAVSNIQRYSLGASGGTMGIVGYFAFWIFANKSGLKKDVLFRLVFLALFIVRSCTYQQGVNTMAHLGGFIVGFVMGYINIVAMSNNKDMEGVGL
ncbi:MAG: rhomboid family intramembrane serine protease [Butyrivibrio sp.]|nr:rhomboid family intramembrane serine protease [Butyrivibrio sp.]